MKFGQDIFFYDISFKVEYSTTIYLSNYLTTLLNNTALLSVPSNFKLSLRSFHDKIYTKGSQCNEDNSLKENGQCVVIKTMGVYIWYSWFRNCLDIPSHMYLLINDNGPPVALSSIDNCKWGPF